MIIKDIKQLNEQCTKVSSIAEGEKIAAKLFSELTTHKTGVGLAANQIGINKQVCVINVKKPEYFINPKIVDTSTEMFLSNEGCLSFPGKKIRVKRYNWVVVEADNIEGQVMFTSETNKQEDILECACVQHEIDHLAGITCIDKEFIINPIVSTKKFGRNEKVEISNGSETKTLKWKKAEPMISNDNWVLSGMSV